MKKYTTGQFVCIAMIAAIYTVLTLVLAPFSFGQIQCRISEMMTVLPAFTPLSIPGLTLGCCLSNLLGAMTGLNPTGYLDAVIGSAATLTAALLSSRFGKLKSRTLRYLLVPFPPVIVNAVLIGLELAFLYGDGGAFRQTFWVMALSVGAGQMIICYTAGLLFMRVLERNDLSGKIFR